MDTNAALFNYDTIIPGNMLYRSRIAFLAKSVLAAAVFWCICRLGILSGMATGWSPLIWPATGFAFAALLAHGPSVLPGLLLMEWVARQALLPPVDALALSCSDCCGILAAYQILRLTAPSRDLFSSTNNALTLVFAAAPAGAACGGIAATLYFAAFAQAPEMPLPAFCLNWIVSCGTGIIIGAPAFWSWYQVLAKHKGSYERPRTLEMLLVSGIALLMGWFTLLRANSGILSGYPLIFLFTPLFLWAALRFSFPILFTFQFFIGICALAGALHGMGPFETSVQQQSILLAHIYLVVLSGTGIIVYAVLAERKKTASTLEISKDVAIASLASLSETRDHETGAHIMRTRHYVRILAEQLQKTAHYGPQLTDTHIEMLYKAAPLHDIGKIGVPDAILLKPGRLSPAEFDEIKKHAVFGRNVLRETQEKLGPDPLIKLAEEIAYTHHEKWDGSGYPRGLRGHEIPLSGRLMALADVYDALISKRVYKNPSSHLQAKEIIIKGSGSHFDPDIATAFIRKEHEFVRISWKYADEENH